MPPLPIQRQQHAEESSGGFWLEQEPTLSTNKPSRRTSFWKDKYHGRRWKHHHTSLTVEEESIVFDDCPTESSRRVEHKSLAGEDRAVVRSVDKTCQVQQPDAEQEEVREMDTMNDESLSCIERRHSSSSSGSYDQALVEEKDKTVPSADDVSRSVRHNNSTEDTPLNIVERTIKARRLLGLALSEDTAWEDRDGMAHAAFNEARAGRSLWEESLLSSEKDQPPPLDQVMLMAASEKGRLAVLAAAVSSDARKLEYQQRAQHYMHLILPFEYTKSALPIKGVPEDSSEDNSTKQNKLDWTGFDRLLNVDPHHSIAQKGSFQDTDMPEVRQAFSKEDPFHSIDVQSDKIMTDTKQAIVPPREEDTIRGKVSFAKESIDESSVDDGVRINDIEVMEDSQQPKHSTNHGKASKIGRFSWISRLTGHTGGTIAGAPGKRKWWRRNKSERPKLDDQLPSEHSEPSCSPNQGLANDDTIMSAMDIRQPNEDDVKQKTESTLPKAVTREDDKRTATESIVEDTKTRRDISDLTSSVAPHKRRDVVAETNERIQKALLTDHTETLTSYDLVKKFGKDHQPEKRPRNDDESVDPLDYVCLGTAGFIDDIWGLNVDSEDEEEKTVEDSVVDSSSAQADNFKRAPKLDPHFVSAPSGRPADLTVLSWDTLIDNGAAKSKDRRLALHGRRPTLFASTEEEDEEEMSR